ncbi:MAG: CHAT domain-containing protein, partial [Saprospiraceae bacterium]
MTNPPVLFFAFADDKSNSENHLRYLSSEHTGIRAALAAARKENLCQVEIRYNVTLDEIIKVFQEFKDRIAIFHFSGHANDYAIHLEAPFKEKNIVYADGLAGYLAAHKGLQMVFLNACATQKQSALLHEKGIPIVIATAEKVLDDEATAIAIRFYQELGVGNTIQNAYTKAINILKSNGWGRHVTQRGLGKDRQEYAREKSSWILNVQAQFTEAANWSLPECADRPLYNLPILRAVDFPPDPLPGLEAYSVASAKIFWGRAHEIRKFYDALQVENAPAVFLLYGASKVGKTSFLQAGLLPRIVEKCILLNAILGVESLDAVTAKLMELSALDYAT